MGQPVVHFEVIGKDPKALRTFYSELFGWSFDTDSPVARSVSDAKEYGFVEQDPKAGGIPGGVGGGPAFEPHVVFYIGVPNVEEALKKAEQLGGKRRMGPEKNPGNPLVVAHFSDPEGNLIGLAGPT